MSSPKQSVATVEIFHDHHPEDVIEAFTLLVGVLYLMRET